MFSSRVIFVAIADSLSFAYPGSSCSACDRRWSSVASSQWHDRQPGPPAHHGHAILWRTPGTGRVYRGGSSDRDLSGGACPVPGTQPCLEVGENERKVNYVIGWLPDAPVVMEQHASMSLLYYFSLGQLLQSFLRMLTRHCLCWVCATSVHMSHTTDKTLPLAAELLLAEDRRRLF